MTFFTLLVADRRPLLPDSTIVGKFELLLALLLRFNEPSRNERDNERESGLSRWNAEWEECGEDEAAADSATFFCSNELTNLSSSARSEVFGGMFVVPPLDAALLARTSESYDAKKESSSTFINHHYQTLRGKFPVAAAAAA
jgi:hypothetical protein